MDDKEYEFKNYHDFPGAIIGSNSPGLRSCNNYYPDGKDNRREVRRRKLRKRKGRL
jgi:hypothetical protein